MDISGDDASSVGDGAQLILPAAAAAARSGEQAERDDLICEVCMDDESDEYVDAAGFGLLLVCEKCFVQVHVGCYIPDAGSPDKYKVPEGDWLCNVCAKGGDPKTTSCELCWNKGGAFRPCKDAPGHAATNGADKWVHKLCATWIPELEEWPDAFSLLHLDQQRFGSSAVCKVCAPATWGTLKNKHQKSHRGAWIQCFHGTCRTAVHPWCLLHNPCGFTKRTIDNCVEIYCPKHAEHVNDPTKAKATSLRQLRRFAVPVTSSSHAESPSPPRKRPRASAANEAAAEANHADPKYVAQHRVALQRSTNLGAIWGDMQELGYEGKRNFFSDDLEGWMSPEGLKLYEDMKKNKESTRSIHCHFLGHPRYKVCRCVCFCVFSSVFPVVSFDFFVAFPRILSLRPVLVHTLPNKA